MMLLCCLHITGLYIHFITTAATGGGGGGGSQNHALFISPPPKWCQTKLFHSIFQKILDKITDIGEITVFNHVFFSVFESDFE